MKYSDRIKIESKEDIKFVKWVDKIEVITKKKLNLTLLELPDEPYRFFFENGLGYKDMAKEILYYFYL